MGKKCCKNNGLEDKYAVQTVDDKDYLDCRPASKKDAEETIEELLSEDYAVSDIHVYKLIEVDFDVERGEIEVEILD